MNAFVPRVNVVEAAERLHGAAPPLVAAAVLVHAVGHPAPVTVVALARRRAGCAWRPGESTDENGSQSGCISQVLHYIPDADGDHLRLGLGQELVAADGAALYHNAVLLRRHALK